MARNMVQFQKGLSEPEFDRQYGSETSCQEALFKSRWPDGFVCPGCLRDSHISCHGPALLDGAEGVQATEHDDGAWLAVVSGPAAEAGADPGRISKRAFGVRIFLFGGFAPKLAARGLQCGLFIGVKHVFQRALAHAIEFAHQYCITLMAAIKAAMLSFLNGSSAMLTRSISKPCVL